MRIVHVTESLDPADGGLPVVAIRHAEASARRGHDVRILTQDIGPGPDRLTAPGVAIDVLPMQNWWNFLLGVGRAEAALVATVARADVLHLHGVWGPLVFRTARLARSRGKPYVIAPHGMLDPWSMGQKSWKKRLALALGYKSVLDHSTLQLLNREELDLLGPLGLKSGTAVVPNGIFLEEIDPLPPADDFRRSFPALGDRPYVLFMSRLHYKKGLDILAEAWSLIAPKFPGVALVVAGPDDGAKADFEARIDRLGIRGSVLLVGPVYAPLKYSALAGAQAFALPTRQEGFSIAAIEALACRIPVVTTTGCHFPEIAEVGAGRVVDLSAERFAAALGEVLADADLRSAMGRAGRRLIEERFTWPEVSRQSEQLYQQLIAGTR